MEEQESSKHFTPSIEDIEIPTFDERIQKAKLTKEKVLDIREKLKTMKILEVSKLYPEACYNTIYAIKTKKLWKNL